jgi:hypothetical protein
MSCFARGERTTRALPSEGYGSRPVGRLLAPSERRSQITHRALAQHDAYLVEWLEVLADADGVHISHPVVSRAEGGRIREVWSCG